MGRLTSEKNPETNQVATTYTYDTEQHLHAIFFRRFDEADDALAIPLASRMTYCIA